MRTINLRYSDSLTTEKTTMINFNQHSKLVNPRFDFGYIVQVHNHRHQDSNILYTTIEHLQKEVLFLCPKIRFCSSTVERWLVKPRVEGSNPSRIAKRFRSSTGKSNCLRSSRLLVRIQSRSQSFQKGNWLIGFTG